MDDSQEMSASEDPINLACYLKESEKRIPTILLPDLVVRRIFGQKSVDRFVPSSAIWLVVGLLPFVVQIAVYRSTGFKHRNGPWTADVWVFYFGLLLVFGLWAPKRTWKHLVDSSDAISDLLSSEDNRQAIFDWISDRLRLSIQWGLPTFGLAISVLALYAIRNAIKVNVRIDLVSYVMVGLIGFVASSGVFWIFALSMFVRRITSRENLKLIWHDPVHSAGISELSRLLGRVFVIAMLGAAAMSWSILAASAGLGNSPERILLYFLLALMTLGLAFVGFAPQIWLSTLLQQHRREMLRKIDAMFVDHITDATAERERLSSQIAFYTDLREASTSTVRAEIFAVYFGAVLTGLAPFVLQFALHR